MIINKLSTKATLISRPTKQLDNLYKKTEEYIIQYYTLYSKMGLRFINWVVIEFEIESAKKSKLASELATFCFLSRAPKKEKRVERTLGFSRDFK